MLELRSFCVLCACWKFMSTVDWNNVLCAFWKCMSTVDWNNSASFFGSNPSPPLPLLKYDSLKMSILIQSQYQVIFSRLLTVYSIVIIIFRIKRSWRGTWLCLLHSLSNWYPSWPNSTRTHSATISWGSVRNQYGTLYDGIRNIIRWNTKQNTAKYWQIIN